MGRGVVLPISDYTYGLCRTEDWQRLYRGRERVRSQRHPRSTRLTAFLLELWVFEYCVIRDGMESFSSK